jgi:hypothetical protein
MSVCGQAGAVWDRIRASRRSAPLALVVLRMKEQTHWKFMKKIDSEPYFMHV